MIHSNPNASLPDSVRSLLPDIQSPDPEIHKEACGRFTSIYFDPLVAYLCNNRKNLVREDAKDIVSDFILKRIHEERILDGFEPNFEGKKRKLRHFVCRNLRWFCGDEQKKASLKTISFGPMEPGSEEKPSHPPDEDVFEYVLAANLLLQSFLAVKADCVSKGQSDMWNVFAIRVIQQSLSGSKIAHASIAERLGLKNAKRSSHLLESGQQKFKTFANRILRESEPDTNRTPKDLFRILAKPPLPNFDLCEYLEKLAELLFTKDDDVFLTTGEDLRIAAEAWLNDREVPMLDKDELNWRQILNQTVREYQNRERTSRGASLSFSALVSHSDETLVDLLFQPTSKVNDLGDIRKAARDALNGCSDPETISMHRTIYTLVHASDIIHHGHCTSKINQESLLSNIELSLSKSWLDEQSRWQLNKAFKLLEMGNISFPRLK